MPDPMLAIAALQAAYAEGRRPEDVVDAVYDRIAAVDDPGIFITRTARDAAKAAATALGTHDPGRALWGIPFAVKDNIDVAGLPTTAACPAFAYTPAASAPAVERLIAAGAILIGKTNLDQFATGLVGVRTPYPVPRNAYDPAVVPGGSSSGSAVAVAQSIVSFALGTDTAGSGRIPAALNNLVGLKPSLGAISARGMVPACRTLDTISVFAGTVDDAWRVYEQIAAFDPADPFSRPVTLGPIDTTPGSLRLGIPRVEDLEWFGDDPAAQAWRDALELYRTLGAAFVEIDMRPFFATAELLYTGPWVAERHAATRAFLAEHRTAMLPVTRGIIEGAARFSATDTFEGFYSLMARRREVAPILESVDALCVPSLPRIPTVAEVAADPLGPNTRLGLWTNSVNLLDLAALAIPGPFRRDKRPAGVTLIGAHGEDRHLAAIGRVLHAAADNAAAIPDAPAETELAPGMIEIAVVGAHMSGMALNGELTEAGGVFRRAGATTASYRLYALPGSPPSRPGLLRVDSDGVAIEAEVWALPVAAFGTLVAAIPAPLTIGGVQFADGTRPKGFLVEAIAVAKAEDISALGSWRAFVARREIST